MKIKIAIGIVALIIAGFSIFVHYQNVAEHEAYEQAVAAAEVQSNEAQADLKARHNCIMIQRDGASANELAKLGFTPDCRVR